MPLISVIVPIYNVASYLPQCIESLQQQSYSPLEIILIDDGSTDNSGDIAERYAKKDQRINVFHKDNGGLSDARNYGIRRANGDYFIFVDSDDYVSSEYVYHLYRLLSSTHALIAATGIVSFIDGNTIRNKKTSMQKHNAMPTVFSVQEALENMLYIRRVAPNAFAKIYDKRLFNEIMFPVGKLYEDIATIAKLIDKAGAFACTSEADYYYRIRDNSIRTSSFSLRNLDLLDQLDVVRRLVESKYPAIMPSYRNKLQSALFNLYMKIPYKNVIYKDIANDLWSQIVNNRRKVIRDKKAQPEVRIASILSFAGQSVFRYIYIYIYINFIK